ARRASHCQVSQDFQLLALDRAPEENSLSDFLKTRGWVSQANPLLRRKRPGGIRSYRSSDNDSTAVSESEAALGPRLLKRNKAPGRNLYPLLFKYVEDKLLPELTILFQTVCDPEQGCPIFPSFSFVMDDSMESVLNESNGFNVELLGARMTDTEYTDDIILLSSSAKDMQIMLDKDLLIVEDLIDTGTTLHKLVAYLNSLKPHSLEVARAAGPDALMLALFKEDGEALVDGLMHLFQLV
ncbi:uncharacterized protein DEA37_0004877, partial [Paragonimus westermani]